MVSVTQDPQAIHSCWTPHNGWREEPVSHSPGGQWLYHTPIIVNVTRDTLAILIHWTASGRLARGACVILTGRKVALPHSHNGECDTGSSSDT